MENTEKELKKLREEFDSTKNVFEELKGFNRKLEEDLNSKLEHIKELELQLKDKDNKISEYVNYKNQAETKEKEFSSIRNDLETKMTEKEKELESIKNELESVKNELEAKISEKEKKIESIKNELTEYMNAKEKYEQDIKANEISIAELKKRNQDLEAQMLQAINIPKLLKEVREILAHKGFISEMEFETILRKI
ncbi:MAG: coiled-coil domain-containing protein [Promethearchaeota archaeon]